jgi:hypothetical protein
LKLILNFRRLALKDDDLKPLWEKPTAMMRTLFMTRGAFKNATKKFDKIEDARGKLYYRALGLIKRGLVLDAHILILATRRMWNLQRAGDVGHLEQWNVRRDSILEPEPVSDQGPAYEDALPLLRQAKVHEAYDQAGVFQDRGFTAGSEDSWTAGRHQVLGDRGVWQRVV